MGCANLRFLVNMISNNNIMPISGFIQFKKKLIHWKVCSASWRSVASTLATKMAQILFPGIGAFYNIIKSWYGTSPYTDSYGLNLGSALTSDQDREITDILRKRVWILSIDFVN